MIIENIIEIKVVINIFIFFFLNVLFIIDFTQSIDKNIKNIIIPIRKNVSMFLSNIKA